MNFSFRHKARHEHGIEASDARFTVPGFGLHYGNTTQPSPGAMAYAYEVLALPQFPPSGPTVATRRPINPTSKPMYVLQAVPAVSVSGFGGTVAGQLALAPLFNPYQGFSGIAPMEIHAIPPNIVDPTKLGIVP